MLCPVYTWLLFYVVFCDWSFSILYCLMFCNVIGQCLHVCIFALLNLAINCESNRTFIETEIEMKNRD